LKKALKPLIYKGFRAFLPNMWISLVALTGARRGRLALPDGLVD